MRALILARSRQNHLSNASNPNVKTLLRFAGANGSTVITDSSSSPRTWTRQGSAALSTAQAKWGTSSLFVNSGYVSSSNTPALGAGKFTIEGWFYTTSNTTTRGLFGTALTNSANQISVGADPASGNLQLYLFGTVVNFAYTFPNNTWVHIALVRDTAGLITLYAAGVRLGTATSTATVTETAWALGVYYNSGFPWVGYIGEFRINVGDAVYSGASFTPPTAPLTA